MRRLFMAIFIPILFILGTPALVATLMYDGSGDVHMPTHLYTEDADAEKMLYAELSSAIADVEDNVTEDMVFDLHQDIINTAIFEVFSDEEMNPDYMPTDDCDSDSCNFVFAEVLPVEGFDIGLRLVGAWVDFEDDRFIGNVFLEVSLDDGFTYKTIIQVHFLFKDLPDRYELEFDKIQIGNLPIPKTLISSILSTVDDQIDDIDLEEETDAVPVGDLDITNLSYTLLKDDILSELAKSEDGEEDTGAALAQEVLTIIFDNELINFAFEEEKFVLTAGVSKFRSDETDIPAYLYDLHFKTMVEGEEVIGEFDPESFDPETYLADKFIEFVFNYALVPGSGFTINEMTFNKLIYYTAEGFSDTRTTYEYTNEDGEIEIIDIGLKAIWFELAPEEINVFALFRIAGIDSILKIKALEVSTSDTELVFEFTEITFGEDEGEADGDYLSIIELEVFNQMFLELEDVEFGSFEEQVDGSVVLKITTAGLSSLMQDGSQEGAVEVNGISLELGAIVLDVAPPPEQQALVDALEAFSGAINTVLEDDALLTDLEAALDPEEGSSEEAVVQAIEELQTALTDDDPATIPESEDIIELFEDFEDMDPESQEIFLDTFEDFITDLDPSIYEDFEDLFTSGDDPAE